MEQETLIPDPYTMGPGSYRSASVVSSSTPANSVCESLAGAPRLVAFSVERWEGRVEREKSPVSVKLVDCGSSPYAVEELKKVRPPLRSVDTNVKTSRIGIKDYHYALAKRRHKPRQVTPSTHYSANIEQRTPRVNLTDQLAEPTE